MILLNVDTLNKDEKVVLGIGGALTWATIILITVITQGFRYIYNIL